MVWSLETSHVIAWDEGILIADDSYSVIILEYFEVLPYINKFVEYTVAGMVYMIYAMSQTWIAH